MKQKPRKQTGMIKRTFRKIGKSIATGLLIAGLMFGSGKVKADTPKPKTPVTTLQSAKKTKPSLGLSLGAGYNSVAKKPRLFAAVSGSIPLPLRLSLFGSLGVSATDQTVGVEETCIELSHSTGPFSGGVGAYTSTHLWTDNLSP